MTNTLETASLQTLIGVALLLALALPIMADVGRYVGRELTDALYRLNGHLVYGRVRRRGARRPPTTDDVPF